MRACGSRKQDIFTMIKLTMLEAGFTVEEIEEFTAGIYNKTKEQHLANMLKAMKMVVSGDFTQEQFNTAFGKV